MFRLDDENTVLRYSHISNFSSTHSECDPGAGLHEHPEAQQPHRLQAVLPVQLALLVIGLSG
jgi:hypothetical protein